MKLLQNIHIGKYLPLDSPIHKLDPRTKITVLCGFITWILISKNYFDYILPFVFLIITISLSHIPFKFMFKNIVALKYLFIVTWLLNIFFTDGKTIWKWGFINITYEGINEGTLITIRLICLILWASILTLTTSPIQLTDALEKMLSPLKKINFPAHEIALMLTISFRFIPILFLEIDKIMKAQMSRGANFTKGNIFEKLNNLIPIFIPLFICSFRRAEELAFAMEARCYHGGEGRTHFRELNMTLKDFLTLIFFIITFSWFIYHK
ncbi:energy-coupling factor transporter transmembrane protein EcfT [Candidatus Poribacteria bacterium]|nr:energy-coupling factor transporter transmembrane protein EcfT [Candidatus Poribacteria bacterium]